MFYVKIYLIFSKNRFRMNYSNKFEVYLRMGIIFYDLFYCRPHKGEYKAQIIFHVLNNSELNKITVRGSIRKETRELLFQGVCDYIETEFDNTSILKMVDMIICNNITNPKISQPNSKRMVFIFDYNGESYEHNHIFSDLTSKDEWIEFYGNILDKLNGKNTINYVKRIKKYIDEEIIIITSDSGVLSSSLDNYELEIKFDYLAT